MPKRRREGEYKKEGKIPKSNRNSKEGKVKPIAIAVGRENESRQIDRKAKL